MKKLYRAKATATDHYVYGDLLFHKSGSIYIQYYLDNTLVSTKINPSTLSRFADLSDTANRPIYSGDIVFAYHNQTHIQFFGSIVIMDEKVWIKELSSGKLYLFSPDYNLTIQDIPLDLTEENLYPF